MDPRYPAKWFIDYFREIIGVNVYGKWFRKYVGWHVFSLDRVLVLVTHRLTDTLIPALSTFTGMPEEAFTLHPHERTEGEKRFGEIYKELYRNVKYYRLWFIENVLDDRYCEQFFSLDERKEMIKKWTI